MALNEEQLEAFKEAMSKFYFDKDDSQSELLFKLFDLDANGVIQRSELSAVMQQVTGEGLGEDEVDAMLQEADTNGDGVIQFNEVIEILKKNRDS